jgi:hypothetical protein
MKYRDGDRDGVKKGNFLYTNNAIAMSGTNRTRVCGVPGKDGNEMEETPEDNQLTAA